MPRCPYCQVEISGRDLGRQAQFKPYRVCDRCGGQFTLDRATRRRQMIAIGVGLVSLLLTMAMYYLGNDWLLPAIISYVVLGAIIFWGNRLLYLVPYPENRSHDNTA